jgi:nitrate/nitrite-specific signal transduction histidine kinase
MSSQDERKNLLMRGQEFLQLYRKVEGFTQDLLKENERLRFVVATLEQEKESLKSAAAPEDLQQLKGRLQQLEDERDALLHRFKQVEQENVDFANRYLEIEEENNNLANLYVASFQLHSTLDFKEVVQIVMEIVINLIGAEKFALMLLDERKGDLYAVSSEGLPRESLPHVRLGEGTIGGAAKEGGPWIAEGRGPEQVTLTEPVVVIPMRIKEQLIGAIVIYSLLEQKQSFSPLDYELFNLLAGHAATALFASKLFSESERKLSTIQGFLELLKQ